MSYLSEMFGSKEQPEAVRFNGYVLCKGCSHARHDQHELLARCECDLCTEGAA